MGGFQTDNEASMAPKQSRASVMSEQARWWGAERGDGGTLRQAATRQMTYRF